MVSKTLHYLSNSPPTILLSFVHSTLTTLIPEHTEFSHASRTSYRIPGLKCLYHSSPNSYSSFRFQLKYLVFRSAFPSPASSSPPWVHSMLDRVPGTVNTQQILNDLNLTRQRSVHMWLYIILCAKYLRSSLLAPKLPRTKDQPTSWCGVGTQHLYISSRLLPQALCWISNNLQENLWDIIIFISQTREMRLKELESWKIIPCLLKVTKITYHSVTDCRWTNLKWIKY